MINRIGVTLAFVAAAALVATLIFSPVKTHAAGSRTGFGFNATLSGFPTGVVHLTGGGSYDASTASNTPDTATSVHAGGGFRCTEDVNQGPLTGCAAREGVRWDTVQLLASVTFKCNGANDVVHTVTTDDDTVVLLADFYRAGDGIDESFSSVAMFVSERDQRPDLPGNQNVWIAGVGCGDGVVNFSQ